jgi:hypothetical protein
MLYLLKIEYIALDFAYLVTVIQNTVIAFLAPRLILEDFYWPASLVNLATLEA